MIFTLGQQKPLMLFMHNSRFTYVINNMVNCKEMSYLNKTTKDITSQSYLQKRHYA